MDEDIRNQIAQLFGDTPAPSAPALPPPSLATLSDKDLLALKLRLAREAETRRIAAQDQAMQQIRTLAAEAGIDVDVRVPSSHLRAKLARAGNRTGQKAR